MQDQEQELWFFCGNNGGGGGGGGEEFSIPDLSLSDSSLPESSTKKPDAASTAKKKKLKLPLELTYTVSSRFQSPDFVVNHLRAEMDREFAARYVRARNDPVALNRLSLDLTAIHQFMQRRFSQSPP